MTDIWDELWKRKVMPPLIMRVMENTEHATPQWIHKVKAEGDKLKEKAENWDRVFDPNSVMVTENEFNELLLNRGKLESIKKELQRFWDDEFYFSEHGISGIRKIIESSEFTTNHEEVKE